MFSTAAYFDENRYYAGGSDDAADNEFPVKIGNGTGKMEEKEKERERERTGIRNGIVAIRHKGDRGKRRRSSTIF